MGSGDVPHVVGADPIGQSEARILDLDLADPDIRRSVDPDRRRWWVPHLDGLFRRREGASLVIADDARSAERLVAEADPIEGQPPTASRPNTAAEPFSPAESTIIRISYDWDGQDDDA